MNASSSDKYDASDLLDLLSSAEDGMRHNPFAIVTAHPHNGHWIYETPPIARLPKVRMLVQIDPDEKLVIMWSASFR